MTQLSLSFLLLSIFCITGMVQPALAQTSQSAGYIQAWCRTTRYPTLCIQSLSGSTDSKIQNPQQLAQAALSVSLYKAIYTKSYLMKVSRELKATKANDYRVVKDCLDQITDVVAQLTQSITELRRLGRQTEIADNVYWHISNVETWTSAAMTDASTCVDYFPGRRMSKLKATIRGKTLNVVQLTSNALALFNRYAQRYLARNANKP
ncbi:putative 21 kDa protein precursor [Tripterygium wilfordii]|uniref:Putative 21 kDa protein n=1 Tax=Tripterygium wilfordii TaxID=458696 RepID=A0A7J7CFN6_TRIWF|nr:pectinesterase inhibitor 11 [Tripterygium wilfordii]KAF5732943.1 putative 21 kDa protein precursor [Tripterygium wilfordii]